MKKMSDSEQIEVLKGVIESLQAAVIALADKIQGDDRDYFEAFLDAQNETAGARLLNDDASEIAIAAQDQHSKWLKATIGFPHSAPNAWSAHRIWYEFSKRLKLK